MPLNNNLENATAEKQWHPLINNLPAAHPTTTRVKLYRKIGIWQQCIPAKVNRKSTYQPKAEPNNKHNYHDSLHI